ncbi:MAG: type IV secretory system conjugative DNA transfer family protein [Nitrospira sp.]
MKSGSAPNMKWPTCRISPRSSWIQTDVAWNPTGRGRAKRCWWKLSLHALYKARNDGTTTSLPAVDTMLADPQRPIAELWKSMTTFGHVNGQTHPVVGAAARDMMDRPEEEAGSVLSSAKSLPGAVS